MTSIALTVNGEPTEVAFAPYKTLLEVLREDLNLCGTKHGCELGECGACAVLLDSQPVLSCLVLGVECEGRRVTTVEGLASEGRLHPLQETFGSRYARAQRRRPERGRRRERGERGWGPASVEKCSERGRRSAGCRSATFCSGYARAQQCERVRRGGGAPRKVIEDGCDIFQNDRQASPTC